MSEAQTDDQLFALLDHADRLTRLRAGQGLTGRDVVARLVTALADNRPRVRASAVYTLGHMASSVQCLLQDIEAGALERDDLDAVEGAHLEQVPPTLAHVLTLWEKDTDPGVQEAAFMAMFFYDEVQRDPERFKDVAAAGLESASDDIRRTAAHALCRFDPTSARAASGLARVLTEPEKAGSNAWQEAAMTLRDMGPHAEPAFPALKALLDQDIDDDLRASVLDAIRAIDTREARKLLNDTY